MVGAPVFFQKALPRLVVALAISVISQALHLHYRPYESAEHNTLAELAIVQLTSTLLLISFQSANSSVPRTVGFVCIVLNVAVIPLVIGYNVRRVRRRNAVLGSFLREQEESAKVGSHASTGKGVFEPSHFKEVWQAGEKSEHQLFRAALDSIDIALERPVPNNRWGQILFTLENLPLTEEKHGDAAFGT